MITDFGSVVGRILGGRYRIVRLVGSGGMGAVYEATQLDLQRSVAVKVLAPSTPAKLFLREMSVWRNLKHVNVLPLLGASSVTGDRPWFFVSPYIRNGNLVTFLKNLQPGSVHEPLRMIREVSKGMEYLHKNGVLHGDLKVYLYLSTFRFIF